MTKPKPTPLEAFARAKARAAIDEFLKQKEFPLSKVVLLAMKPFAPALREVWLNGFLAAWGLATSEKMAEEIEKQVGDVFGDKK